MKTNAYKKPITALFLAAVAVCCGAALPSFLRAAAEGAQTVVLQKQDFSPFLPTSYEQYLSLSGNVNDVCVKGSRVAVADGSVLYLYDGTQYRAFGERDAEKISQIEWGDDGNLYFKYESQSYLSSINPSADPLQATDTGKNVNSSFTLDGETVYSAYLDTNTLTIYKDGERIDSWTGSVPSAPLMTCTDGKLYYTVNGYLYELDDEGKTTYAVAGAVSDFAIYGGEMFYTADGALCSYRLSDNSSTVLEKSDEGDYAACSLDGNDLYLVFKTATASSIRRYDLTKRAFSSYEICASSTADRRLFSATACTAAKGALLCADENRIVVSGKGEDATSFSCNATPVFLAADENTIVFADALNKIYAYDYAGNALAAPRQSTSGTVTGLTACKDGAFYLTTANNVFIRLTVENGEWREESVSKTMSGATTKDVTSDLGGDLYVLDSGNRVYRFTEEEFLSSALPQPLATLSAAKRIRVDLDGNIYGVDGNRIVVSDGESEKAYTVDAQGVLYGAPTDLCGFDFSDEDGKAYFLFENYVLCTDALSVLNLAALPAGDAYDAVYNRVNDENAAALVEIRNDSLFVRFDADSLSAQSQVLPYLSYGYANESRKAVVLGETDIRGKEYYLLSLYDAKTRRYASGLARKSDCTLLAEEEYAAPSPFDGAAYLTNDVYLYRHPNLSPSSAITKLNKNAAVTVLKTLSFADALADYDYYFVRYDGGEEPLYGYLPTGFLRETDGRETAGERYFFAAVRPEKDVLLTAENGETYTLKAGKNYTVAVFSTEGEEVVISYEENGVIFRGNLPQTYLIKADESGVRIFFGVFLILVAAAILVNYLVWRKKERR